MTEEKKNKLFYKFLAWTFGISVVISMSVNFWQIIKMGHHSTAAIIVGVIGCFICAGICFMSISTGLTYTCIFFIWFFRTLVEKNINWIKKEFGLNFDEKH